MRLKTKVRNKKGRRKIFQKEEGINVLNASVFKLTSNQKGLKTVIKQNKQKNDEKS